MGFYGPIMGQNGPSESITNWAIKFHNSKWAKTRPLCTPKQSNMFPSNTNLNGKKWPKKKKKQPYVFYKQDKKHYTLAKCVEHRTPLQYRPFWNKPLKLYLFVDNSEIPLNLTQFWCDLNCFIAPGGIKFNGIPEIKTNKSLGSLMKWTVKVRGPNQNHL